MKDEYEKDKYDDFYHQGLDREQRITPSISNRWNKFNYAQCEKERLAYSK